MWVRAKLRGAPRYVNVCPMHARLNGEPLDEVTWDRKW